MAGPDPAATTGDTSAEQALRTDWSSRFSTQAAACADLGSELYGRLLEIIAADIDSGGPTWSVISSAADLRYGQMGPLRLVGGAHRLALSGAAPDWANVLPSCGGEVPVDDETLRSKWLDLVAEQPEALRAGLDREVQTNEVARSSGLGLALASTGFSECRLIELGCSGGLNLRLDRYRLNLGDLVLGDPDSALVLEPEMRFGASAATSTTSGAPGVVSQTGGPATDPVGGVLDPSLKIPQITSRVGIDPHPIDATTPDGRWTLSSFVWPDQSERFGRLTTALAIAAQAPVELVQVAASNEGDQAVDTDRAVDTAQALQQALQVDRPRAIQHSIVWQYIPTELRWRISEVIEAAGRRATADSPLAWIRYEPDEWNRTRASIWLRTWPGGADRLVANVDFHGRWLAPVPPPSC